MILFSLSAKLFVVPYELVRIAPMTGYLRFIFALCVVYTHFGPVEQGEIGHLAVFGFYMLSGFFMTRILNDAYSFHPIHFAVNRILKLFPPFLVVSAMSVMVLAAFPLAPSLNVNMRIPQDIGQWTRYLTIAGIDPRLGFLPIPPSWSIAVEIVNYAIIWAVAARDRRLAWVVFVAACTYHWASIAAGEPITTRYSPFYAAILPFTIGALLHHEGKYIDRVSDKTRAIIMCSGFVLWLVIGVCASLFEGGNLAIYELLFYGSLLCLTGVVYSGKDLKAPKRWRMADKLFGDLSYPIFLSHYLVGFLVSTLIFGYAQRGVFAFLLVSSLTVLFALPVAYFSERFVEPLRDKLRPAGTGKLPLSVAASKAPSAL